MNSNNPGETRYAELVGGYQYPVSTLILKKNDVAFYLTATGGENAVTAGSDLVPPLAAAARAIAELSNTTISPPGTVHLAQELEFWKAIPAGERLEVIARVEKKLGRGDWQLLTTVFTILDSAEDIVMEGRISVGCHLAGATWWQANAGQ